MTFGLSESGFQAKRLQDISDETVIDWKGKFGDAIDLDARRPAGQIKGILDERITLIWEVLEALYFSQYPRSSSGVPLDNAVALVGITRKNSTPSTISSGKALGTLTTVIPIGTIISVDGNSDARFITDADAVISNAGIDEIQKIILDTDPDTGTYKLSFAGSTTGDLNYNDNAATVQAALELLVSIGAGNVTVSGSMDSTTGFTITFVNTKGAQDQSALTMLDNVMTASAVPVVETISEETKGSLPFSDPISLTAETDGPTTANADTLSVIETPVVGLDSFTNTLDAELGTDIETDAELKTRQVNEVQIAGAATLNAIRADVLAVEDVTAAVVFMNNSFIVDVDGRQPKTVDIVVENGNEDDIAQAIFDTVAAGIGYEGDITKTVADSQGFDQTIKFSRPTSVDIYVEVDLTTDPTKFDAINGPILVEQAIVDYGDALEINDDVIVFGSIPSLSCSFASIPGITDFIIRVGKTVSPVSDANVPISPREIASFDTSRTTVVVL